MVQDIVAAIIAFKFEIAVIFSLPLINNLFHFDVSLTKTESLRTLISAMTGITFDMDFYSMFYVLAFI